MDGQQQTEPDSTIKGDDYCEPSNSNLPDHLIEAPNNNLEKDDLPKNYNVCENVSERKINAPIKLRICRRQSSPSKSDSDQFNTSTESNGQPFKKKKSKKKKKKKDKKKAGQDDTEEIKDGDFGAEVNTDAHPLAHMEGVAGAGVEINAEEEEKKDLEINTKMEIGTTQVEEEEEEEGEDEEEERNKNNIIQDNGDNDIKQENFEKADESELEKPESVVEDERNAIWKVGELIWGKVTGHPWWPGMVSYDPYLNIYVRRKTNTHKTYEYHVQYFGNERERGWLLGSSIQPFTGPNIEEFKKTLAPKHNPKRKSQPTVKVFLLSFILRFFRSFYSYIVKYYL